MTTRVLTEKISKLLYLENLLMKTENAGQETELMMVHWKSSCIIYFIPANRPKVDKTPQANRILRHNQV